MADNQNSREFYGHLIFWWEYWKNSVIATWWSNFETQLPIHTHVQSPQGALCFKMKVFKCSDIWWWNLEKLDFHIPWQLQSKFIKVCFILRHLIFMYFDLDNCSTKAWKYAFKLHHLIFMYLDNSWIHETMNAAFVCTCSY